MTDKADKKAFALRINADMLKALEEWAAEEFRSTNGQIEFLLAQALAQRKRAKKKDTD
ncbi:ribbon-helix-helix domain-containing protein [Parapedobacter sp. DT-150]|uniref:ribbon-helix-helix domain-containing protein n=1 Tax=Parapedobacter sp. DT-150 TaxID=3396162 RepID=UPI003F1E413E